MPKDNLPGAGAAGTPSIGDTFAVVHAVPGRLRLKLQPPHTTGRLDHGRAALMDAPGVRDVRARSSAWSVVVEYDPARSSVATLLALPLHHGVTHPPEHYPDQAEATALIAAPVARVWQVLTDPTSVALHAPGTVHVHGRVASDHWTAEVDVLGKVVTLQVAVAERMREHRLVLALSGPLRGRLTTTLTPEGPGTRVYERLEYALPGKFLGWLVSKLAARPRLRSELADHLEQVAAAATAPPPPSHVREEERGR